MENTRELADLEYATRAARMLLHSYPNQPHDEATFLKQLVSVCVGRPKAILQLMVSPTDGFLAAEKFLTIAALNEWFDQRGCPRYQPPPEQRPLLPEPENELTPAEILRRIEVSRQLVEDMRARQREEDRARVKGRELQWLQAHAPSKLLEALVNLDNMKLRGDDAGDEAEGEHQAPADEAGL